MKKLLGCIVVIVLCAAVTHAIDHHIGVKFTDVSVMAQYVHKVAYMAAGGALIAFIK